jgi:Flp pilus assembly protein TadG
MRGARRRQPVFLARGRRGAALVELAIAMVLLLLLVLGILEFGIMFRNYLSLAEVARAGCRSAAIGSQTGVVFNRVVTTVSALGLTQSNVTNTVSQYRTYDRASGAWSGWATLGNSADGYNNAPCDQTHDSQVKVTVTYSYTMITGSFLSPMVGNNGRITLHATSVMRREATT